MGVLSMLFRAKGSVRYHHEVPGAFILKVRERDAESAAVEITRQGAAAVVVYLHELRRVRNPEEVRLTGFKAAFAPKEAVGFGTRAVFGIGAEEVASVFKAILRQNHRKTLLLSGVHFLDAADIHIAAQERFHQARETGVPIVHFGIPVKFGPPEVISADPYIGLFKYKNCHIVLSEFHFDSAARYLSLSGYRCLNEAVTGHADAGFLRAGACLVSHYHGHPIRPHECAGIQG